MSRLRRLGGSGSNSRKQRIALNLNHLQPSDRVRHGSYSGSVKLERPAASSTAASRLGTVLTDGTQGFSAGRAASPILVELQSDCAPQGELPLTYSHSVSIDNAERAILVGVETGSASGISSDDSLAELGALAHSAGAEVAGQIQQKLRTIDPRTFIGRGKTAEVRELARNRDATLAIFDDALSPAQARNLENELKLRVVDRAQLILDIFAQRARTLEGKLQVEIAQLSYLQPRLTRQWLHLSRVRGGGTGGGGVG